MNKPIINGIDVSECAYYNKDNAPYCCEVWDNECEAQNCYFKQLKHLQQENKKLKEVANEAKIEYENLLINRNDFAERAEKLEQENKELKETVENLLKIQYALADSCNKYSKVLEEIKTDFANQVAWVGGLSNFESNIYKKINEVLK